MARSTAVGVEQIEITSPIGSMVITHDVHNFWVVPYKARLARMLVCHLNLECCTSDSKLGNAP